MTNITFYKIICNNTGEFYIGSTKQKLNRRMTCHESNFRQWKKGNKSYNKCGSYDIIDRGNYKIKTLLVVDADTTDLKKRKHIERLFIEKGMSNCNKFCLNKNLPGRTALEYRNDNRDGINAYHRTNYHKKYKKRKQEYYYATKTKVKCEFCKKMLIKNYYKKHLLTKSHRDNITI